MRSSASIDERTSSWLLRSKWAECAALLWRPFRAGRWGEWFLGLKPQAESCSPFGAPMDFGHFKELRSRARPRELSLLGVGPGSRSPKGQESLAQGLPWVLGLSPEALKGRPLTRRPGTTSRNAGASSGLVTSQSSSSSFVLGWRWRRFARVEEGLNAEGNRREISLYQPPGKRPTTTKDEKDSNI
jgi:hypothetical protein